MAERQAEHRQMLETKVVDDDFRLKRRGQDYALISTIVGLIAAVIFAVIGATTVAGIVGGTTVVGVVTAFVAGRVLEGKNNAEDKPEA